MIDTSKAALFLGPNDQPHYVDLIKRARAIGAEVSNCFQAHVTADLARTIQNLLLGAANGKFGRVIVPSIKSLCSDPVGALELLSRLLELGIRVESLAADEGWIPASPDSIAPLVGWLRSQTKARRSDLIRKSLERARAEGRCGRPKKITPPEAIAAVEAGARIAEVCRRFQPPLAPTTLRRAVAEHRAQLDAESRRTAA